MSIIERIAYIKGLAEGMALDKTSNEGKLFAAIIEALEDIALEVADTTERVDMIDSDLADVEDYIDDLEEAFDDDWDDEEWYDDEEEDEDADDDGVYEFECPNCHETVYFDDSIFEDDDEDFELECPACGAKLDSLFELDDEDGDDED
jgi:DNA-directed RNA polymerase subunit RPC12/RpoP